MDASPTHTVILCSRLDLPGGIERAVVNCANLFTQHGLQATLLILDETADSFYPINEQIRVLQLPLSFGITPRGNPVGRKIRMLSDVLRLRRQLRKLSPTHIIATEYPFAAAMVLAGMRTRCRLISWEHHHVNELDKNTFWDRIFRHTYPRIHHVVCLNADEQRLFESLNDEVRVIPNFVEPAMQTAALENTRILTVARLNHVKGIDLLVKVAAAVLKKYPGWEWKIIGQGKLEDFFEDRKLMEELGDRLVLQAPSGHDIQREYRDASIYVMTSRNECFPMTLLEAHAAGVPCIAFDCETGPRHIIEHNTTGFILPMNDLEGMIEKISMLVEDDMCRKKMGRAARHRISRFSPDAIFPLWKNLLSPNQKS